MLHNKNSKIITLDLRNIYFSGNQFIDLTNAISENKNLRNLNL